MPRTHRGGIFKSYDEMAPDQQAAYNLGFNRGLDRADSEYLRLRSILDEALDYWPPDHSSVAGAISEVRAILRRAFFHEVGAPRA